MGKSWIIILTVLLLAIIGFAIYGYSKVTPNGVEVSPTPTKLSKEQIYFSNDAKVMYFYSDYCHWCQKEEADVLPQLGEAGYRFKPMDLADDASLGSKYSVNSTPTFVAANGDRLTGYQEEAVLKTWMDQHR